MSADPLVLGCRPCEGAFLDNVASQLLVDDGVPDALRRTYVMASGVGASTSGPRPSGAPFRSAEAPDALCPICRQRLRLVQAHGVHLDICAAHGTWLDRGEAELLRKAYSFERAKKAAAAAQIGSRREAAIREVAETGLRAPSKRGPLDFEYEQRLAVHRRLMEWWTRGV